MGKIGLIVSCMMSLILLGVLLNKISNVLLFPLSVHFSFSSLAGCGLITVSVFPLILSEIYLYILFYYRYQMPLALVGLISCLALWDVFKFCSERWGLDQYPIVRQCLIRFAQCGELLTLCLGSSSILLCICSVYLAFSST